MNAVSSPLELDGQDVHLEEDGDGVELGHVQSLDGVSRHVQDTVFALGRYVLGRIGEYFYWPELLPGSLFSPKYKPVLTLTDWTLVPYRFSLYWPASINKWVWMSA